MMMAFTDEDLKRLKEHLKFDHADEDGIKESVVRALIARLKAAEKVCEFIGNTDDMDAVDEVFKADELMAAWRKAAGK
jgi:hypothetical protein